MAEDVYKGLTAPYTHFKAILFWDHAYAHIRSILFLAWSFPGLYGVCLVALL